MPLIKSHRLVGERRSSALREDEESRILDPARCIRVFESRAFELFLPPTWPPPKTDSLLTTNRRFSRPISRSLLIYFNYTPVIIINYRVSIHRSISQPRGLREIEPPRPTRHRSRPPITRDRIISASLYACWDGRRGTAVASVD